MTTPPQPLGWHHLLDYHGCDRTLLNDSAHLRSLLLALVAESGATIITDVFHTYSPQGVSGVVVIAESHVAIHTWPEHGVAAVDYFSCSQRMDVERFATALQQALGAQQHSHSVQQRGLPPVGQANA